MPNLDLTNKNISVPEKFIHVLGDSISGNNLTTKKSRLEKKENLTDEESSILSWLTSKYKEEVKNIDTGKRVRMNTGEENVYKKTHKKDGISDEPDKVQGLVKLTNKGNHTTSTNKMSDNRVNYYESINKEINKIKYLIEYFKTT